MTVEAKVKIVSANEGDPIWLAHSLYEVKCSEGSVSIFKMTSPPNMVLAPFHSHPFDEVLLVAKGLVQWTWYRDGDDPSSMTTVVLEAGDLVFFTAGVTEMFETLDEPAEMYWFMMGDEGTSEQFFKLNGVTAEKRELPKAYEAPTLDVTRQNAHLTGFATVP